MINICQICPILTLHPMTQDYPGGHVSEDISKIIKKLGHLLKICKGAASFISKTKLLK